MPWRDPRPGQPYVANLIVRSKGAQMMKAITRSTARPARGWSSRRRVLPRLFRSAAFGPTRAMRSTRTLPLMSATPRTPRADPVAAPVVAAFDMAAAVEVFTVDNICDVGWESPAPEVEA